MRFVQPIMTHLAIIIKADIYTGLGFPIINVSLNV